jgi:hypothetical protein
VLNIDVSLSVFVFAVFLLELYRCYPSRGRSKFRFVTILGINGVGSKHFYIQRCYVRRINEET